MKKLYLLIMSALCGTAAMAEDAIKIDEKTFPDETFRNYISDNVDGNSDGELSASEIAATTSIDVSGLYIEDLAGIEYFTSLEELDCYENSLTSLDVSGCTALTELNCRNNQLASLDVSGCIALTELNCKGNQLTSLNISGCAALKRLYCGGNQFTSLNVSSCTALEELYCDGNQLTGLDLTKCTALTALDCGENQLTSLDVSECTAITALSCYNNKLTSLDVSKLSGLRIIYCYNNKLTSLDVTKCTALTELDCYNNKLTSLDVSKMSGLEFLYFGNNNISSIDLSECTALKTLCCGKNMLTSLDLSKCSQLSDADLSPNKIKLVGAVDLSGFTIDGVDMERVINVSGASIVDGKFVAESSSVIMITYDYDTKNENSDALNVVLVVNESEGIAIDETNFPDDVFRAYISENIDTDENGKLTIDETMFATELYVREMGISDLKGIEHFTNIVTLSCSYNNLTSLDVSKCTALANLYCYNNSLTSLDVSECAALEELECYHNEIETLDVSGCTVLEKIVCYENRLTSLDLSKCTVLFWLECGDNQLTSLDVSKCTALFQLKCHGNQLTSLDLNGCTMLMPFFVDISGNERDMGVVPLSGFSISGVDMEKVSNVSGATVVDGLFVPESEDVSEITYDYDAGRDNVMSVTLYVEPSATATGMSKPAIGTTQKARKVLTPTGIVIEKDGARYDLRGMKR